MLRWQKRLLLLLAVADLLVIGGLGWVVWHSMRRPPVELPPPPPRCEAALLTRLPQTFSAALVWERDRLLVRMELYYAAAEPPEGTPQQLWVALDAIRDVVQEGCPLPPLVTLHLTALSKGPTVVCEAVFDGADLVAWAEGRMDDAALATQARYRRWEVPAP